MSFAVLWAAAAAVFLVLDAVMLTAVMQPLFARHIGHLMLAEFRVGAAAAFYVAYVAGLAWLAGWPALKAGAPGAAVLPAAVVGFIAYGTFEFTNYAILKDWHWSMVAADVAWGTVLSAASAWTGVWLVLRLGAGPG